MKSYLIKIYHSFSGESGIFRGFLENLEKVLEEDVFFGLHYAKWETFYSFHAEESSQKSIEGTFYTDFPDFQIVDDTGRLTGYNSDRSVVGIIGLENGWFFPFKEDMDDFIANIFRAFDGLDPTTDRFSYFIRVRPIHSDDMGFYFRAKWDFWLLRIRLVFSFFRYLFNFKTKSDWKAEGRKFFEEKIKHDLFRTEIFLIAESRTIQEARSNVEAVFHNFSVFKNFPLNAFTLKIESYGFTGYLPDCVGRPLFLSPHEVSLLFHFPKSPKLETSLLKVSGRRLAPPIGAPILEYTYDLDKHIVPKVTNDLYLTPIGSSDYRSITVPIGAYDEDRLRHLYVIGQTGVGKSKFLINLMIEDIQKGKGICMIDPHGDTFEELIMHIPPSRKDDVIIFDPTDEKYPFCFNPLDIRSTESKQILAKGFIDIFKKFFGANWNPKLEHVLRMIFLALLDKKGSTLFDIIRALTDKDFRYTMIEVIEDDVVRNFWTNEFAGWSQQFNSEAIMPILNKVGQLLSVDMLRNIFASTENKLDFREVMDSGKILLIKLPKWQLQEEIMGFLGAMFITKIFQAAMGRQSVAKEARRPFFLYVDEFQNFATETFGEILSEARKYGLGLTVAHQYLRQIPPYLSNALFGNVGTLTAFRVSTDDAGILEQHFAPYVGAYDLANLNAQEFYCRMLIKGQIKPPFSLRTLYIQDVSINPGIIKGFYDLSRAKYSRSLAEAKKVIKEEQKDVVKAIEENFGEPIL